MNGNAYIAALFSMMVKVLKHYTVRWKNEIEIDIRIEQEHNATTS